MEILKESVPPRGWSRLLWRLPIQLYRMRLGWLLGGRFMLLFHTGRVSGRQRRAVIEVIVHDAAGRTAASGFGARSDWYRNLVAAPEATIQVRGRRIPVTAVLLDADAGEEVMAAYSRRHPGAAKRLCALMGFGVDGGEADYREVGRRIPFVRFEPR